MIPKKMPTSINLKVKSLMSDGLKNLANEKI